MADTSKTYFKPLPAYQREIIKELGISIEPTNLTAILEREKVYVQKMNEAREKIKKEKKEKEEKEDKDENDEENRENDNTSDSGYGSDPILNFKNVKSFKEFKDFVLKMKADTASASVA